MKKVLGILCVAFAPHLHAAQVILPPLTNKVGVVVSNAVAIKAGPFSLMYSNQGAIGYIPWDNIPEEVRQKLAKSGMKDVPHETEAMRANRPLVLKTGFLVLGKVVAINNSVVRSIGSMVIQSGGPETDETRKIPGPSLSQAGSGALYRGLVTLTGYTNLSKVAVGDVIKAIGYPNGTTGFTKKGEKSVFCPVFTVETDKVSAPANAREMQALRNAR